jgi:hypothetical protein
VSELTPLVGVLAAWIAGGVLVVAGITKMRAPARFAESLQSFWFLPSRGRGPLTASLPIVEAAVGGMLVLGISREVFAVVAASLFAVFAVAVALVFGYRGQADCGCLGHGARAKPASFLLGRNACLVILALVAWAGERPMSFPASQALVIAFVSASLALAVIMLWPVGRVSFASAPDRGRRHFLRLTGLALAGGAATVLGLAEREPAEASCFGCGTCGYDYVFLYCNMPCCAIYWIRPYNDCVTSCPACSARTQMFCGIPSCC